jgi:nitroimidazol reductase NimA-like FMN-containing flavoprotein (pyridoxamine 5'-phosphate oxidase superfamily)
VRGGARSTRTRPGSRSCARACRAYAAGRHETAEEVAALQRLLDETYARIGTHMRSIHTEERRASAADVVAALRGVRVLDLATVTANCEPRVGPVDGLFLHGRFYFGSGADSVRFRHIRRRPQVSAAHTVGETFAVIVHGTAVEIDLEAPEHAGFVEYLREVYPTWDEWQTGEPAPYAYIVPARMYAYAFDAEALAQVLAAATAE